MRPELDGDDRPTWRYALYLEDQQTVACGVVDSPDFFSNPGNDGLLVFTLRGAVPADPVGWGALTAQRARRTLGNIEIWILDLEGRQIGAYHVGAPTVREIRSIRTGYGDEAYFDIILCGYRLESPHPHVELLWDLWRSGGPTSYNQWAQLPPEDLGAWLEVVRMSCEPCPDAPSATTFTLDGSGVRSQEGFYCAMGEAINGPGGYFGGALDGLIDCLRGGFGATTPFALEWIESENSIARLEDSFHAHLLEIFDHARVSLILLK